MKSFYRNTGTQFPRRFAYLQSRKSLYFWRVLSPDIIYYSVDTLIKDDVGFLTLLIIYVTWKPSLKVSLTDFFPEPWCLQTKISKREQNF